MHGILYSRVQDKVSLTYKQYLKKLVQRFGMTKQSKPIIILHASHFKLGETSSPSINFELISTCHKFSYSNAIGNLMYAMVHTNFDIYELILW